VGSLQSARGPAADAALPVRVAGLGAPGPALGGRSAVPARRDDVARSASPAQGDRHRPAAGRRVGAARSAPAAGHGQLRRGVPGPAGRRRLPPPERSA
jgi:hypothetical protein